MALHNHFPAPRHSIVAIRKAVFTRASDLGQRRPSCAFQVDSAASALAAEKGRAVDTEAALNGAVRDRDRVVSELRAALKESSEVGAEAGRSVCSIP